MKLRNKSPSPISANEICLWFRDAFKQGPWPKKDACTDMAARLELERKAIAEGPAKLPRTSAPSAAGYAKKLLDALPEREEFWCKLRRQGTNAEALTAAWTPEAEETIEGLRASIERALPFAKALAVTWMPDAEQAIAELRASIERAIPFLDFPPRRIARRRHTPWHGSAFLVAVMAIEVWRRAGGERLSLERNGPLVGFVVAALERLGVKAPGKSEAPSHNAVAKALSEIKSMDYFRGR